jgi:hypothetical protein
MSQSKTSLLLVGGGAGLFFFLVLAFSGESLWVALIAFAVMVGAAIPAYLLDRFQENRRPSLVSITYALVAMGAAFLWMRINDSNVPLSVVGALIVGLVTVGLSRGYLHLQSLLTRQKSNE